MRLILYPFAGYDDKGLGQEDWQVCAALGVRLEISCYSWMEWMI